MVTRSRSAPSASPTERGYVPPPAPVKAARSGSYAEEAKFGGGVGAWACAYRGAAAPSRATATTATTPNEKERPRTIVPQHVRY